MKKLLVSFICVLLVACGGDDSFKKYSSAYEITPITTEDDLWDFRIRAYIDKVLSLPWTDEEKASNIKDAAARNNVSPERISQATKYSIDQVNNYLALADGKPIRYFTKAEEQLFTPVLYPLNIKDYDVGAEITVRGKWLDEIEHIYFNNRKMQITKRGYEQMVFVLDKKECGVFSAEPFDSDVVVNFGFHGVSNRCGGEVVEMRAVQNFVQLDQFVNGKTLGVQAAVKSNQWPLKLRIEVENGGEVIYSAEMDPPKFRDVSLKNGSPYYAAIPGQFVKPGITIKVIGYPEWNGGIPFFRSLTPSIDPIEKRVKITVVEFTTTDGQKAEAPSLDLIRNAIIRALPLPDDVELTNTQGQLSTNVISNSDWSISLTDITILRQRQLGLKGDYSTIYYGFVPWRGTSIVGIAYLNSYIALGISAGSSKQDGAWEHVFIHELGHVLGRPHAPCGNAANVDKDYPYPGGAFGPTPAFNLLTGMQLGLGMYDIMGYCGGKWFSDYNYQKVKEVVEKRFAVNPTQKKQSLRVSSAQGFKISVNLDTIKLLSSSVMDIGGGNTVKVYVDGVERDGRYFEIDHINDIHVWIPGEVGHHIEVTINGITYVGEL